MRTKLSFNYYLQINITKKMKIDLRKKHEISCLSHICLESYLFKVPSMIKMYIIPPDAHLGEYGSPPLSWVGRPPAVTPGLYRTIVTLEQWKETQTRWSGQHEQS